MSITELDLTKLTFNYSEGLGNVLVSLLEKNNTLTKLNLNDCNIGFYYDKYHHHNIPVNEQSFYEALKKNTTLTSLSMTVFSYNVVDSIADVLSKNSSLTQLELDTYIKPVYDNLDEIMKPLMSNTTLTSLSLTYYTPKPEWKEWDDYHSYYKLSYP